MARISASLSMMNCLSKLCPFSSAISITVSPMVIDSPECMVCEIPSSSEPSCITLKVSLNPLFQLFYIHHMNYYKNNNTDLIIAKQTSTGRPFAAAARAISENSGLDAYRCRDLASGILADS